MYSYTLRNDGDMYSYILGNNWKERNRRRTAILFVNNFVCCRHIGRQQGHKIIRENYIVGHNRDIEIEQCLVYIRSDLIPSNRFTQKWLPTKNWGIRFNCLYRTPHDYSNRSTRTFQPLRRGHPFLKTKYSIQLKYIWTNYTFHTKPYIKPGLVSHLDGNNLPDQAARTRNRHHPPCIRPVEPPCELNPDESRPPEGKSSNGQFEHNVDHKVQRIVERQQLIFPP